MEEEFEIESVSSNETMDYSTIEEGAPVALSGLDLSLVDLEGALFHVEVANMEELNEEISDLNEHVQSLEDMIISYSELEYAPFFSADVNSFSVTNTLLFLIFLILLFHLIYKLIGGKPNV